MQISPVVSLTPTGLPKSGSLAPGFQKVDKLWSLTPLPWISTHPILMTNYCAIKIWVFSHDLRWFKLTYSTSRKNPDEYPVINALFSHNQHDIFHKRWHHGKILMNIPWLMQYFFLNQCNIFCKDLKKLVRLGEERCRVVKGNFDTVRHFNSYKLLFLI